MTQTNPERITQIYTACQFREGEKLSEFLTIKSGKAMLGFHRQRLHQHAEEIRQLLALVGHVMRQQLQRQSRSISVFVTSWQGADEEVQLHSWESQQLYHLSQALSALEI